MEIRKYTFVDVHYTESENKKARKEQVRLLKLGYELQEQDAGSAPYDYCDQYIRYSRPFKIK